MIVTGLLIRLVFVDISLMSLLALVISLQQFMLLFNSIGYIIPTRHLLSCFMCIQFFIGPVLVYNGLEEYQYFMYHMRIPEFEYFQYVMPAVVCFIAGLHINAGNYRGEIVDRKGIESFLQKNPGVPYFFIVLGLSASVLSGFFASELAFVFYLLGSTKFIGLFLLLLGTKQIKPIAIGVVLGSILLSSLSSGMFHDLLTWIVFTSAIFGIKYRFDFNIKIIGLSAFVFMVIVIQILKTSFRSELGRTGREDATETFARVYEKQSEGGGFLDFSALAQNATRINQGFIITNIMVTVPAIVPFADGEEMWQILEAAVMPRILAPDKLRAGDRTIFVKYSHIPLAPGTSMGLSSVGDAYINFGIIGGIIFMFILGLFYGEVLNSFHKHSSKYPVLILFLPLVFYYPIRPDCEFQTILNHLVKSCVLLFVMIQVWKNKFTVNKFKLPSQLTQVQSPTN